MFFKNWDGMRLVSEFKVSVVRSDYKEPVF